MVALELGHKAISIDINPRYTQEARKRLVRRGHGKKTAQPHTTISDICWPLTDCVVVKGWLNRNMTNPLGGAPLFGPTRWMSVM